MTYKSLKPEEMTFLKRMKTAGGMNESDAYRSTAIVAKKLLKDMITKSKEPKEKKADKKEFRAEFAELRERKR